MLQSAQVCLAGMFEPTPEQIRIMSFFELYKSSNGIPYVQIFYRNSSVTSVLPLEIPKCGTKCSLTDLYELYKDSLPMQSFEKECELRENETLPASGNPENGAL